MESMEEIFKNNGPTDIAVESTSLSHQRIETKLKLRKDAVYKKLFDSRMNSSNKNQNQSNEMDFEEVEEEHEKHQKGYLPLDQYQKNYYSKAGKRCWYCKSWYHLKNSCPKMRCFYCGAKGHFKSKCFKYELHKMIQILKNILFEKKQLIKEPKEKKETMIDRMKQVVFKKDKLGRHILVHKEQELAVYDGDYVFTKAKKGFERQILPNWKMEKVIQKDTAAKFLKLSDYLPHQCFKDGEVCNGFKFLDHLYSEHRGICPAGSLINASPYRFWLIWYDDENYERFTKTIGDVNYVHAEPPWIPNP